MKWKTTTGRNKTMAIIVQAHNRMRKWLEQKVWVWDKVNADSSDVGRKTVPIL